ncbi:hypothetical protein DPEC_G00121740 [Dallia pectoralis]|uniref:Uncharacterized protein n=1 Tax=Dallia pectoralis TaxID=75939 RepID=A0ACC2GQT8_DALPE|nr:hypothetical protein DPEC_G00121740 [Dallia pectoralis]
MSQLCCQTERAGAVCSPRGGTTEQPDRDDQHARPPPSPPHSIRMFQAQPEFSVRLQPQGEFLYVPLSSLALVSHSYSTPNPETTSNQHSQSQGKTVADWV